MNRALLLSAVLAGCSFADAGQRRAVPFVEPASPNDDVPFDELVYVDVRGATQAMEMVRDQVRALDPSARTEVAESMNFLARNCPYTRASIQLPRAMHQVFVETPLGSIDALAQSDWEYFRRGLTAHVDTHAAMGVALPLPESGDYLFRAAPQPWLVDEQALRGAANPMVPTESLLAQVDDLVEGIDESTMEGIRFHTGRVDHHIGHSWTLSNHLQGWREALLKIEPHLTEPEAQAKVRQMLEALDRYGRQGC
jgi:hypothetical protein